MRLLIVILEVIFASGQLARADDIKSIPLQARDVVFDPGTKKMYASVPGSAGMRANTITVIDPVTGTIGTSAFIGSEPARMALSDRGKYIWVALDGAGMIRRFDLATQSPSLQFSLGTGLTAEDI